MSYESDARRRSNLGFRTVMDLGMGLFYAVIGTLILLFKSFGNMAIPPVIAYVLGGMMVVGGVFRFYKGVKSVLDQRKEVH